MRNHVEPYRFASCLSIVVLDCLVYAGTMTFGGWLPDAWLTSTIIGSALTFGLVATIEARAPTAPRHPFFRALGATIAVAMPMPVLGTAFGIACLIWALLAGRHDEPSAV
jgi:hypothetical protein